MTRRIALVLGWLVLGLAHGGLGAAEEGVSPVPPWLVTATRLQTLITETKADPALAAGIKDQLGVLYRKALSNLQVVEDKRARADAFAQAIGTAQEQTRRIRERVAAAKAAEPTEALPTGFDTPLYRLDALFQREQAERDAAEARRAEIERQLADQENRPAAICQRLAAAQKEQETIAAALQAGLAGDTEGVVTKIRIRATTIRDWDRKELLVPNKEFITGRLLNWSLSDQVTRVMVTVGVAYGTDVEKAHALMGEAAEQHPWVLKDPRPILSFEGFGDNSLTLILRAYIGDIAHRLATITDLHKAINDKFQQAGISIAFPQRDLHLDVREPVRVSIGSAQPDGSAPIRGGLTSRSP